MSKFRRVENEIIKDWDESYQEEKDESKNSRNQANLFMNGRELYLFTLSTVPIVFNKILEKEIPNFN